MKTGKTAKRSLAWILTLLLCFGGVFSYALADTVGYQQEEAVLTDDILEDGLESSEETDVAYALQALAMSYGQGEFLSAPPAGSDVSKLFSYIVGDTLVDSQYSNVAIATLDATNQFGAMWADTKLDLTLPFSTEMYLYLGHSAYPANSFNVADGMTFTMHDCSDALEGMVGGRGEGLGVWTGRTASGTEDGSYLPNALVIEFDTYTNAGSWSYVTDPTPSDSDLGHCALIIPRASTLTNPINVDDHINNFFFEPQEGWVEFSVQWEPQISGGIAGGRLTYTFDGTTNYYEIPDVNELFGSTEVWWGFTGSTGGQTAVQAAAITKLPTQEIIAVKTVKNGAGESIDGGSAAVGDTLTYTVKVTANEIDEGVGPVIVTDELSEYTKYAGGPVLVETGDGEPFKVVPEINGDTIRIDTGCVLASQGDWLAISFDVKTLKNGIDKTVTNTARVYAEGLIESQTSNTTSVSLDASYKIVESVNDGEYDGGHVKVGDEIVFRIGYINKTGKVANLVITDELESGLTHVSGGVYDSGIHTVSWEIDNVPADGSGSVLLAVTVNENAGSVVTNSANLSWDTDNDGVPDDVEIPSVSIPDSSYKAVASVSEAGYDGTPVKLGDEITFQIGYVNNTGEIANLKITDALEDGFTYVSATDEDGNNLTGYSGESRVIEWEIANVPAGGSGRVTLTVKVNGNAGLSIRNTASLKWESTSGGSTTEEFPQIEVPVSSYKLVDKESEAGVDGASVTLGDEITYRICYINNTGDTASLTISDELPEGLEYRSNTGGGNYIDLGNKVVWEIDDVPAGEGGYVSLTAEVTAQADVAIKNVVSLSWDSGDGQPETESPEAENPVGYSVVYDANSGVGSREDRNVPYDTQYSVLSQSATGITRDGYNFTGWDTKADGTGISYSAGDKITIVGNITLYAQWTEITGGGGTTDTKTYSVIYHANNSLGQADKTYSKNKEGDTITVQGGLFTAPDGKVFAGWSLSPDGIVKYTEGSTFKMPAADMHLYAVWKDSGTYPSIDDYEIPDDEIPYGLLSVDDHFAYIIGYPDGNIRPQGEITREEVATIFFRLLTEDARTEYWSETNSFSDVSPDRWSSNAISTLVNAGIIKGYADGTFRPDASITRAELAVIVARFDKEATVRMREFNDISDHWAKNYIMRAALKGWVKGYEDGTFRPDARISRAEVMTLINRVLNRYVESKENMLEDMVKWSDNAEGAWYYLDVQEATNSHFFERKEDSVYELWTELRATPDWSVLEKHGAKPGDIQY